MIPGEKLILHGKRNISASCKALELECRDEDFPKKNVCVFFLGASKTLAKTLIPGTWRDPHEFGLWPIAQIVNPCTGEAKRACCGRPEQPSPAKGLRFRA